MAVFTHLTDDEIAEAIAPYGLGQLRQVQPIAQGVENSNWKLELDTPQGALPAIFTLFEKRTNPAELPFFIGLMEHLAAHGVPCPAPYVMADGHAIATVRGRPCVLVRFLNGQNMAPQTSALLYSLGAIMAQMHVAAQGFADRRPNPWSLAGWQQLADALGERLNDIADGLHDQVMAELAFQQAHWRDDLPQGIIHADLFRDNVMVENERVVGLFDFYFACHDALAYDLAICLNCWCFDESGIFQRAWAAALLQGYQRVRPLAEAEQAALPQLARGAALRFLLTRAHDWIHHPPEALVTPKDPMEYAGYLRFHQAISHVKEYGV